MASLLETAYNHIYVLKEAQFRKSEPIKPNKRTYKSGSKQNILFEN